jgi:hypothetical protein
LAIPGTATAHEYRRRTNSRFSSIVESNIERFVAVLASPFPVADVPGGGRVPGAFATARRRFSAHRSSPAASSPLVADSTQHAPLHARNTAPRIRGTGSGSVDALSWRSRNPRVDWAITSAYFV